MIRFPSSVVDIFFFINSFFRSTVIEWNNLDLKIRHSETFSAFKKSIWKFIRPSSNAIFNCDSFKGIKLFTRFRLDCSLFREHKFRHNSQDTLNAICRCGDDVETTIHYLLHCPNYLDKSRTLFDDLQVLEKTFMIKMVPEYQNCFYLAFFQIMMHQIHVF